MRTRVKICGISRVEDALHCASVGVDAIGLVFYADSPRAVSVEQADQIVRALPPFVTTVGLFVDARQDEVNTVLENVQLDYLQFHGNETVDECETYNHPYIKAIRMAEEVNIETMARQYGSARALLLDTFVVGQPGGTGQTFNWGRVPASCEKPVILAGGLTPENVAEAIRITTPYAVDVSGGVERSKGLKDHEKIDKFLYEVEHSGI